MTDQIPWPVVAVLVAAVVLLLQLGGPEPANPADVRYTPATAGPAAPFVSTP